MTNDKSLIQSCVDHINTAVDVDPWAKELVCEMGKEILEQLNNPNDCISRQAVKDKLREILRYYYWADDRELDAIVAAFDALPPMQPTYTDAEIQKMQDMHQAEIEKAFALGREDAMSEIIHCKDCKHKGTKNCVANAWTTIFGVTVKDDFYCGLAERRTDD